MTDDIAPREQTYEVGYGKPPKETRFQPGHSGNPRGRPKKPKSIQEKFERELTRKVAVREDGRVRKIPKIDLWVRRVIADAIKGAHQASRILIEMRAASDDEIAQGIAEQSIEELNAEDREILARYLRPGDAAAESGIDDGAWPRHLSLRACNARAGHRKGRDPAVDGGHHEEGHQTRRPA